MIALLFATALAAQPTPWESQAVCAAAWQTEAAGVRIRGPRPGTPLEASEAFEAVRPALEQSVRHLARAQKMALVEGVPASAVQRDVRVWAETLKAAKAKNPEAFVQTLSHCRMLEA